MNTEMVLPLLDPHSLRSLNFGDLIRIQSAKDIAPGCFYGNKRYYILAGGISELGIIDLQLYKLNPWNDAQTKEREDALFLRDYTPINIYIDSKFYPLEFPTLKDDCRYYLDKVIQGFDIQKIHDDKALSRHREYYLDRGGCGFMSAEDALNISWPI